jgi:hypothetical protein
VSKQQKTIPRPGDVVYYRLAPQDRAAGLYANDPDDAPDVAPATITRLYFDQALAAFTVNLFVMRDLAPPLALQGVPFGEQPGSWSFRPPPRPMSAIAPAARALMAN